MDGHWAAAVAGHVERGESVYDAARREAREEVGLEDVDLVPWCAMQRTGVGEDPLDERVDYFFVSTSWTGATRLMEPEKAADLRWLDLTTLPTPVASQQPRTPVTVRCTTPPPRASTGCS